MHPEIVIVADAERALVELCGITLIERLLRILQRIGVDRVTIISPSAAQIREHLSKPSWARGAIAAEVLDAPAGAASARAAVEHANAGGRPVLLLDGGVYFDPRLLRAMMQHGGSVALVDSSPPPSLAPLIEPAIRRRHGYFTGGALLDEQTLRAIGAQPISEEIARLSDAGSIPLIDVHEQPAYVADMRRDIRPLWFPAPRPENAGAAEQLLLDAAQNGTLDLPAMLHGPIETWIVARLCRTRITPMHITLFTAAVSAGATALFASGRLFAGTVIALIVGILDGLDGKQARVKVETTELGKREHALDFVLELSWWAALAYHFSATGKLPHAHGLLALLIGSDLVDRFAKRTAKQHTGRNLDDFAPIDRFVRLIGGRRNIYIWMLAIGVALGAADKAFALLCYWGAATAAVHVLRACWITLQPRTT